MFDLLRKKSRSAGSVLFRGTLPPRLENFHFLRAFGVELEPIRAGAEYLWAASASHPQWGQAELFCPRETPVPTRDVVRFDPRLTEAEVNAITDCGSSVQVAMSHEQQNVLRERKLALRMMNAVLGEDGVSIADHGSQRFWSRPALDEELAHDAELDIESLFTLHAVQNDETDDEQVIWLHSHGLAELGYFDFDILEPSSDLMHGLNELTRAIAYGIVEGWIERDSNRVVIGEPNGVVRLMPVDVFQRRAPARFAALRDDPEGFHSENRSVVCEPVKRLWSRLMGDKVEPSRWLRGPIDENSVIHFSGETTNLIAKRARGSYSQCRLYSEEFAEFEVSILVKIGVQIDGGAADEREHLWFEATSLHKDRITGTLLNEPWHIAALKAGESYTYGLDMLSDWAVYTPAGRITPVEAMAVRTLRANRDEILKELREGDTSSS
jgi:uncharacterized protein YegJ (DUF2314 family)